MEFKGLEKNSVIEWPGKVVAVAYTGGCNFRCPYCQNSDLVERPEELPTIDGQEVIEYLVSKRKWLDGVVITGGEPTLHHHSLLNFFERVKGEGFEIGMETNGSNPEVLEDLIARGLLDYVGLDIKAPFEQEKYGESAGIDGEDLPGNVLACMDILRNSGIDYEYRTTVVPEILDPEDVVKIGKEIEEDENYYLQQFSTENTLEDYFGKVEPYDEEALEDIKETLIEEQGLNNIEIRNL